AGPRRPEARARHRAGPAAAERAAADQRPAAPARLRRAAAHRHPARAHRRAAVAARAAAMPAVAAWRPRSAAPTQSAARSGNARTATDATTDRPFALGPDLASAERAPLAGHRRREHATTRGSMRRGDVWLARSDLAFEDDLWHGRNRPVVLLSSGDAPDFRAM